MRKFFIIIIIVLALLKTQAQNILISFSGAGDTTVVSTVKVDNLTSGAAVTLNGGDTLQLKPPLGIGSPDIENGTLRIYPNPMAEESRLTFVAPEMGNTVICIADLSGKTVCQINILLSPGKHSFRILGISQGMYFVTVTGKNYSYSTKLISQGNIHSGARIEYVSSDKNTTGNPLKSPAATIDMEYRGGDILMYKGIAGQYSTIVTDVPVSSKTITFNFVGCTDNDGNHYATVSIGSLKSVSQIWMAENLNVGVSIYGIYDQSNNGILEKYCYGDYENNCGTYGGLYQWNEMMQYETAGGAQGICPAGFHLPTDAEWQIMVDNLGGNEFAGGKMKESFALHWAQPNTGATNSSGFSALPGGIRMLGIDELYFHDLTFYAVFWTSTHTIRTEVAWDWDLGWNHKSTNNIENAKIQGASVRCIHNFP